MPYTGELIALTTVLCWTISIQFFEAAARRVGSTPVNMIRISCALILFGVLLFVKNGFLIPLDFPLRSWVFLSLMVKKRPNPFRSLYYVSSHHP